jgi:hypothetical protein
MIACLLPYRALAMDVPEEISDAPDIIKNANSHNRLNGVGAPEEIRTPDPQIRSLMVRQRSRRNKDRERPREF